LGVFCLCFDAHALWHLGYPDRATQRMDEALTLAEQLGHPFSRALALAYASMLYQFRREADRTREAAETATALCREQGFPYYLAWVLILRGWALTAQAHTAEGIEEMRSGLSAMRATGAKLREPYYLALLAEACIQQNESQSGLALLAEALGEGRDRQEQWHEAELHRLRGEFLTRSLRDDDEAAECFHRALDLARAHQSRALELRAATSLARLWRRQGKRAAPHALLAPIYRWFTEGFDTADLQEAGALLDDLSSARLLT
jgi:predicted ATPase